ncbi:MAG: tRNA pseudouridine(38-40) synthase TruA [Anaerolineales bacterium]
MARYQSIIAYDGTAYHGFQRQADGIATVQAALEAALVGLGWQGSSLLAAGRTDAGVHARGQVIAFDLDWNHRADALTRAMNSRLPADIALWRTRRAPADFHPRFDARTRRYRYRLIARSTPDPLRERYAWRVWPEPDTAAMDRLASALVGPHDFGAYGKAPIEGGHTKRTVRHAAWAQDDDEIQFDIAADAFLHHMIRRLAAACVGHGTGRVKAEEVTGLLDRPDLRWEGRLAPPRGLCLMEVEYGREHD